MAQTEARTTDRPRARAVHGWNPRLIRGSAGVSATAMEVLPEPPEPTLPVALCVVSSLTQQIEGNRGATGPAAGRLRQLLERAVTELHAAVTWSLLARSPTTRVATSAPQDTDDVSAFLAWLTGPRAHGPDRNGVEAHPDVDLTWRLTRLTTSRRPLPQTAAEQLGMRAGTSIADAARQLLLATLDPNGPNCPDYDTALLHLRDHGGDS